MSTATPDTIHVTAAILRRGDGRVLLARRRPGLRHAGCWEFPGGKVECGETPPQGLVREMREEFGIDIVITGLYERIRHRYAHVTVELWCYTARWPDQELILCDHDRIAWALPRELPAFDLLPADVPVAARLAREASGNAHGSA
jgi:8-oxo-dGTP diphosphatase